MSQGKQKLSDACPKDKLEFKLISSPVMAAKIKKNNVIDSQEAVPDNVHHFVEYV